MQKGGALTVRFTIALNLTVAKGNEINCAQNPATSRPKPIPVRKTKFDLEAVGFWIANAVAEALMVAPDVVSTTTVLLGVPHAMLRPGTLLAPEEKTGATEDANKLEGCTRVTVQTEKMAEVTGKHAIDVALACPAMRSEGEIVKITAEVEPIMHISDRPIKTKGETQASRA